MRHYYHGLQLLQAISGGPKGRNRYQRELTFFYLFLASSSVRVEQNAQTRVLNSSNDQISSEDGFSGNSRADTTERKARTLNRNMYIKCDIFLFSPWTVYTSCELLLKFDDCFTSSCKVLFSAFMSSVRHGDLSNSKDRFFVRTTWRKAIWSRVSLWHDN